MPDTLEADPFVDLIGGLNGAPAFQQRASGGLEPVPKATLDEPAPPDLGDFSNLVPPPAQRPPDLGEFASLVPNSPVAETAKAFAATPEPPEPQPLYDFKPGESEQIRATGPQDAALDILHSVNKWSGYLLTPSTQGPPIIPVEAAQKALDFVSRTSIPRMVTQKFFPKADQIIEGVQNSIGEAASGATVPENAAGMLAMAVIPGLAESYALNVLSDLPQQYGQLAETINKNGLVSKQTAEVATRLGITDIMGFLAGAKAKVGRAEFKTGIDRMAEAGADRYGRAVPPSLPGSPPPVPAPGPTGPTSPSETARFQPEPSGIREPSMLAETLPFAPPLDRPVTGKGRAAPRVMEEPPANPRTQAEVAARQEWERQQELDRVNQTPEQQTEMIRSMATDIYDHSALNATEPGPRSLAIENDIVRRKRAAQYLTSDPRILKAFDEAHRLASESAEADLGVNSNPDRPQRWQGNQEAMPPATGSYVSPREPRPQAPTTEAAPAPVEPKSGEPVSPQPPDRAAPAPSAKSAEAPPPVSQKTPPSEPKPTTAEPPPPPRAEPPPVPPEVGSDWLTATETPEPVDQHGTRLKLRSNKEGGFVNADILKDVGDFARKIYQKGMDFADWAGQMIGHLGLKIKPHLQGLWDSLTGADFLPRARERGEIINPFDRSQEKPTPQQEFGDKENARWHIKQYETFLEKSKTGTEKTQAYYAKLADSRKDQVERARAFVADEGATEVKRTQAKMFVPKWSVDKDVARFLSDDVAKKLQKEGLSPEQAKEAIASHLEQSIEEHRSNNEGERMGSEFWDDAKSDLTNEVLDKYETQTKSDTGAGVPERGAREEATAKPSDFTPALRTKEGTIPGEQGQVHDDIYAAQSDPTALRASDPEHGFTDKNGDFKTRDEVSKALGEDTPMQSERLLQLQAEEASRSITAEQLQSAVMDAVHEGGMIQGLKEGNDPTGHYVVAPPQPGFPEDGILSVGPFKNAEAAQRFLDLEVGALGARVVKLDRTGGLLESGKPAKPSPKVTEEGGKLKLRADNEGGFVSPEILKDVQDFGKKIYQKGIGFAKWSGEMIRHLGEKVRPHLKALWDSITGRNILPKARESGSILNPFKIKGTANDLNLATTARSEKLQTSSANADRAQRDIRRIARTTRRQNAISVYIEAAGQKGTLDAWESQAKGKAFKRAAGDAKTLTPAEIALAQKIAKDFRVLEQRGNNYDVLTAHRDNYVPHVWEVEKKLFGGGTSRLKSSFKFNKARSFNNFFEGDQAGFTPKTLAIGDLFPAYLHEMDRVIADRQFVQDAIKAKDETGAPHLITAGRGVDLGPDNPTLVNPHPIPPATDAAGQPVDTSRYERTQHKALSNWKWVSTDPATGKQTFLKGDLAASPELQKRLNAMMGQSEVKRWYNEEAKGTAQIPRKIVKALDRSQSVMKREMFGNLAPFHQVQEATHAIGHSINPFWGLEDMSKPTAAHQDAMRAGLMLHPDKASAQSYIEGVGGRRTFLSQITRKFGGRAGEQMANMIDGYQNYLFHQYIPALKFKTYTHVLERNMKRFSKDLAKGEVTAADVKFLSAEQVNAAYGHLNYALLDRNPTIQHALQIGLLAPDFLEARGRFTVQAAKGLASKTGREQLRAVALLAAVQAGSAAIISETMGDGYDPKHPFEAKIGNRSYTLRSVPEDLFRLFFSGPDKSREFIRARLNPLAVGYPIQAVTGQNYRGEKTTFTDTVGEALANYIPIMGRQIPGIRDLTQTSKNSPTSPMEQLAGSLGFKVSRFSPITEVYQLADQWKKDKGLPRDTGVYPVSKYQQLRYALEDSDYARARVEKQKLLDSGIQKSKLVAGFKESINHPFTGNQQSDAEFRKSLSPEDRLKFDHAKQRRKDILLRFGQIH